MMDTKRGFRRLPLLGTGVLAVGVLGGTVASGTALAQAQSPTTRPGFSSCVAMEELVSDREWYGVGGEVLRLIPPGPQGTLTTNSSPAGAPDLDAPMDMAFLPGGDIAVTDTGISSGINQVVEVNGTTGARTLISGNGRGKGPALNIPRSVVVESGGDILVGDDEAGTFASQILRIDPATGDRTRLSGNGRGSGPAFGTFGVNLGLVGGVIYAMDISGQVMSVDSVTGNRTLISGATRGTGSALVMPLAIAAGTSSNSVVVVDQDYASSTGPMGALVQVDLATGDRTVLSSNASNPSKADKQLNQPYDLWYNACEKVYYVLQRGTLLKVDATSGDRDLFTSFTGHDNYSLLLRPIPVKLPTGVGGVGGTGGGND
jgi:hypothetical protein